MRNKQSKLYSVKRLLLDVVYPNRCPFCDCLIDYNAFYCNECFDNLEFYPDCGNGGICNIALFEYNEASLPFIYGIKENADGYAISAAASLLKTRMCEQSPSALNNIDIITCVPTDNRRLKQRGYNPPEVIASELSHLTGIMCKPRLLVKTRNAGVQKSLSASERAKNIKGVFAVKKNAVMAVKNAKILVIDDVCTTGATLSEVAAVLKTAGAGEVYTAVVAKTEMESN